MIKYKTEPYKHQKETVEFFLNNIDGKDITTEVSGKSYAIAGCNFAGLFMEMGTGKSKTVIDIVSNLHLQGKIDAVLLVAPNGVQTQWINEQVPTHSPVYTKDLLWRNSKALYYTDMLSSFTGEQVYSTKYAIEQYVEPVKTEEQKRVIEEEASGIDDMFADLESTEAPVQVAVEETIPEEPEIKMPVSIEEQENCLKWLYVNVDRFSSKNMEVLKNFSAYLKNNKVAMIIDESTVIKNPTANRSRHLTVLGRLAKYRFVLTGTPITNSPFDIYSMMEFCKENFWKCNYFIFKNRYGMFIKDVNQATGQRFNRPLYAKDFGMIRSYLKQGREAEEIAALMGISESNVKFLKENTGHNVPYKRLEEIKKIVAPYTFIVKKEDCLDLPPKMYQRVPVQMNKEQVRLYKELTKQYFTKYDGEELTVQHKLTLSLRLQQIAGGFFPYNDDDENVHHKLIEGKNPKIEKLRTEIEEAGDLRIIVWSRFRAEIKAIVHTLRVAFPNKRIEGYFGDTNTRDREEFKQDFQAGLIDVMVINPQTGAMGLNLQRSSLHYYFSNTHSLHHRLQSEDRSHRIGQTENVMYKDLIATGTMDEKILESLKCKKNLADYFKDNHDDIFTLKE